MKYNHYIIWIFIFIIIYLLFFRNLKQSNFESNFESYNLPKIIWSHWDNINTLPNFTKIKIEERNKKLYDWKIIFLNNTNINEYINQNEYPENYDTLGIQHKADWIRLFLLKKHGGLWLDTGIIINSANDINKIYLDCVNNKSELSCFYYEGRMIDNNPYSYIENWFMLAPKNSKIINIWYDEFTLAIKMGFYNYRLDNISKGVKAEHIYYYPTDTYLTMHAAMQKMIQLNMIDIQKIKLYRADDNMFKIHNICNWNNNCIKDIVKNDKSIENLPFIKLRGIDRPND